MSTENKKLTSVKIDENLFEEFKVATVRYKFTLQKLTERAIHLYLTNPEFRKTIHNHNNTILP
jgi:hypothetical protein